jgi:hypothetical protein
LWSKIVFSEERQEERSGHLFYWLRAHRYTDSMTLTQALKENMGDLQIKRSSDTGLSAEVGPDHSSVEAQ